MTWKARWGESLRWCPPLQNSLFFSFSTFSWGLVLTTLITMVAKRPPTYVDLSTWKRLSRRMPWKLYVQSQLYWNALWRVAVVAIAMAAIVKRTTGTKTQNLTMLESCSPDWEDWSHLAYRLRCPESGKKVRRAVRVVRRAVRAARWSVMQCVNVIVIIYGNICIALELSLLGALFWVNTLFKFVLFNFTFKI